MANWFTFENDTVEGPFETEVLLEKVNMGSVGPTCLIWGPLQEDWRSAKWWQENLQDLLNSKKQPKNDKLWHFVINNTSQGPVKRAELIEIIKSTEDKSDILVWTNGMADWMPLFSIPDLANDSGVSRRKHPRCDIDGQVIINYKDQNSIGQLLSISPGGCGLLTPIDFPLGEVLQLTIRSNKLAKEFKLSAELRYISPRGHAGLMFTAINSEEKALIVDYIRGHANSQPKAA